jgi:hypothetical protein
MSKESPRQELLEYMERGWLRDAVARGSPPALSQEAQDLLVNVVARYCEPRRQPRRRPLAPAPR